MFDVQSGAEAPQFKGYFTPFGIKFGFGSLAIFKALIDAKSPDDLSSSCGGQRVEEVTIEYVEVFTGLL